MEKRFSRDIGRYSLGEREGGEVLGMGVIIEDFQSDGKTPVEIDKLKICWRGIKIEAVVAFIKKEGIPSGPQEVLEGRLAIRLEIESNEQKWSLLIDSGGVIDGLGGGRVLEGGESLVEITGFVLICECCR